MGTVRPANQTIELSNHDDDSNKCQIDHFTVVCLVAWPLNEGEAGGDLVLIATSLLFLCTVEPRFNEVAGDRPNLFVKSRVRYIENLDITNLRGNDQNVRYIEVIVND